jgi:protein-S-isoprenylcysteine O-methyltransferase Ste14
LRVYAASSLTIVYAVAFLANLDVPRTVDIGGATTPAGWAIAIDVALLGVFGLQHSVMARPGFKTLWTRFVPAPVERSTYLLFSVLALMLVFWQWRPIPAVVWDVAAPLGRGALWALYASGWLLMLLSTFLIDHFELFGLQQVWRFLRQRGSAPATFNTPFLYRIVRHPLYVGFIVAFWAAPTMTAGHLVFALVATAYIVVAVRFEERDLASFHPEYVEYSKRVPMLIPRLGRRSS